MTSAAGPEPTGTSDRSVEASGRGDAGSSGPDRTTRRAALWATAIALPLTLLAGVLIFGQLSPEPDTATAAPTPSATAPRVQSSAPVSLPAAPLAQRPATVCRALLSQLPSTLRDLRQRPVTAGAEQNAAYGDPALTVVCGVPPTTVPATDDVWVVNQVCWHATQRSTETVLVTVDREVPIQVTVPSAYEQPLQWVAPIADTVVGSVRSTPESPAGCRG